MGMVLQAEHRRLKRIVALKMLSPTVVKTPELLRIELKLDGGKRSRIGDWPAGFGDSGRIVAQVRIGNAALPGSIRLLVNGATAAEWTGDLSNIGLPTKQHPRYPNHRCLAIFCFKGSYKFQRLQLNVIDGLALPLK